MTEQQLAITEEYQSKILAFMTNNEEFRAIASDALEPEHFTNKALQWFYNRLSEKPTTPTILQEEMIRAAKNKEIKEEDISKYVGLYDIIKHPPLPVERDHITQELGTFIRVQAVKNAVQDALPLIEQGGAWEQIAEEITAATQAGFSLQDTGKHYFDPERIKARIEERANREQYRRIPFGIPQCDQITHGGIKNKQTGLVVGGTGRGKSIMLEWLGRVAVMLGKKVLYITLELDEDQIEDRYDSMFARVKPHELNEYQREIIENVGGLGKMYGDSLVIKHFPMDTATVGTFKAFIRQLSNMGIFPDLVLIDYLDLIKPHRTYNDINQEQIAVVKAVVGMGQELDVAIWTATQLNRGGLVMETPDEGSQAGTIARQFVADMVVWLAQTRDEKEDEIMRLVFSKNRNGPLGTVTIDTDYSYMTFYREQKELENGESEGTSGEEGQAEEKPETSDGNEEKGDLQRMLLDSEERQSVAQEQSDWKEHLSDVLTSNKYERGGTEDSEGSDSVS